MFYCAAGGKGMQIVIILPMSIHVAFCLSAGPGTSVKLRCTGSLETKSKNGEDASSHT